MKHRISSGVIVERDRRILLVHCVKPGRYDFWVAPGGGVKGDESLVEAAQRETLEETGLTVLPERLVYIEELADPETRHAKFWHTGKFLGGEPATNHPEAQAEGVVEVAWLSRAEIEQRVVFPYVLCDRYWTDREQEFPGAIHLGLRHMEFY